MIRLVLHHARKDLRGVRPWLALWLVLLAVNVAGTLPSVDLALLQGQGRPHAVWTFLLSAARVVLGMLLVVRVVHADPPAGTTGFWLTRPLPARAVLGAKLLVIGALVGTAAAAHVAGLLANSLRPGAIPRALVEIALFEALPLLPLAVAASLTRDTARMVLSGLACFLIYAVGRGLAVAVTEYGVGVRLGTGVLLLGLLVLGWSLLCFGVQYLARQVRRTLGLALAGLALAAAVGFVAPFRPAPREVTRPWPAADSVTVGISAPALLGNTTNAVFTRRVYGTLDVQGVPPGVVLRAQMVDGSLRFADGHEERFREKLPWEPYTVVGQAALDDRVAAAVGHALQANVFHVADGRSWLRRIPLIAVDHEEASARADTPGRYEATIRLVAYRLRLAAVVPARPGERTGVASHDLAVVASDSEPDLPNFHSLVLRLTEPALAWQPAAALEFLLVNRSRGEAMPGRRARVFGDGRFSLRYLLAPVPTLAFSKKLPGDRGQRLDDAWFEHAELAILMVEEEGTFTKRVSIDGFKLQ